MERRGYGVSCHISAARKPRVQRDATRRGYREEYSTETRSQCGGEQGQDTGTQRKKVWGRGNYKTPNCSYIERARNCANPEREAKTGV